MPLADWVKISEKKDWSADLLDPRLQRYSKLEQKLFKLLYEAILCVDTVPSNRRSLPEIVMSIEDVLIEFVIREHTWRE